jgi:hypothetical protein
MTFLKCGMALLLLALPITPAIADPQLQGGVEQDSMGSYRIARPSASSSNGVLDTAPPVAPSFKAQASTNALSGVVDNNAFASQGQAQTPLSGSYNTRQPLVGNAAGGRDEWWINWDDWRRRVTDTVWGPLQGAMLYGQTRVDYDVTRDHRIHITNVFTPDPTGISGRVVANRIMQLDGDPVLEFPSGSQQQVHHNFNMISGRPFLERLQGPLYLPGGMEHVERQW